MTSEWTTNVQEGYRTKFIQVGNCTIEIHRPILSDEERVKREDVVKNVLRNIGKEIR